MNERVASSLHFFFERQEPQRLDVFLVDCITNFSRNRIQGLIKDGRVTINEVVSRKSGQLLEKPCEIQVNIPPIQPTELIPESIPLDIIFENKDLMVVNKPAGMVVHPAVGHSSGTLVHAALAHAPEMEGVGGELRPGVVHRLDKNTSGLILLAKNDLTHHWLQDQFRQHKIIKTYIALVDGSPPTLAGRIEAPIGRDPKLRQKMAIVNVSKGRQAESAYRVLESFPEHTLLEVIPITGRTHQIRLHLSFLGCPVAGDTIYGRRHTTIELERHFLHAASLEVHLLDEVEARKFLAPLPDELIRILENLRN